MEPVTAFGNKKYAKKCKEASMLAAGDDGGVLFNIALKQEVRVYSSASVACRLQRKVQVVV